MTQFTDKQRTRKARIRRLKERLDLVPDATDIATERLIDVVKGILDLLEDEL